MITKEDLIWLAVQKAQSLGRKNGIESRQVKAALIAVAHVLEVLSEHIARVEKKVDSYSSGPMKIGSSKPKKRGK